MKILIIIPAYNPDQKLKVLIQSLKKYNYTNIIVINDGSKNRSIFDKIKDEAIILQHNNNLGKGKALKNGITYVLQNLQNVKRIITVDADGQHKVEDINKVYQMSQLKENSFILGSRNFKDKIVPFRSKIGNKIMSYVLYKKYNKKIKDTQTGLRAISKFYFENLIQIPGDRFEYEMNVILYGIKNDISIIEVPIESIYIEKNKSSHYRIIRDSWKINQSLKG